MRTGLPLPPSTESCCQRFYALIITKTNIPRCHSEAQLLNKKKERKKKKSYISDFKQQLICFTITCLLCAKEPVDICGNQPMAVKLLSLSVHLLASVLVLDSVSPVAPTFRHICYCTFHGDEAHPEQTAPLPGTTPETKELGLHQSLFPNLRLGKQYLTRVCAFQCLCSSSCPTTFPEEAGCFCALLVLSVHLSLWAL